MSRVFRVIGVLSGTVTSAFLALSAYGADAPPEPIVLQHSEYVSNSGQKEQRFATRIDLRQKDGSALKDNAAPLTLTFYNGSGSEPKFAWIRIFVTDQPVKDLANPGPPLGRLVVSEANFKGAAKVDINATGALRPGQTFMVQGAGAKGAKFSWQVTTPPPGTMAITTLQPPTPRAGGSMSIVGTGFSTKASQNLVYFNQSQAQVVQATATLLEVAVPPDLQPGNYTVQVKVNGQKTNTLAAKVKGAPEVTRSDWQAGPCGQEMTIYGKNFSENAGENSVFFSNANNRERASVKSATSEALVITVPQFPELQGANAYISPTQFTITVTVGTTPAKGQLSFTSTKVGWQQ